MSTEFQPSAWKPVARTLTSLDKIPWDFEPWVQVKVDGEMTVLVYNRNGETYTVNLGVRKRGVEFPHIAQAKTLLDATQIESCIILGETHAMDGTRFLHAPELNHRLKSRVQLETVYFGAWDFLELNHQLLTQPWHERIQRIPFSLLLPDHTVQPAHVLPYIRATDLSIVNQFYATWVTEHHAEGLYIRDKRNSLFKYKPYLSVDAAIIGINKTPLYEKQMVSSFKVGLLSTAGDWIDLGDVASGIDPELRKSLWALTSDIKQDMGSWHQIPPGVIVEVQMTQLFNAKRDVYHATIDGRLLKTGKRDFYSMRHPRLIRFRSDKTIKYEDIRETQLPEILEENLGIQEIFADPAGHASPQTS